MKYNCRKISFKVYYYVLSVDVPYNCDWINSE